MAIAICRAWDGGVGGGVVEPVGILDREIFQGDVAAPEIEGGDSPVALIFAAPGIPGEGEGQDGLFLVFALEDDIVLFDEDLLVVGAFFDQNMPRGGGVLRQAVDGRLDGCKVTVTGGIDDDCYGEEYIHFGKSTLSIFILRICLRKRYRAFF